MFERFTEKARRAIFFARYEASQFGSDFITLEHLLLGLLREDEVLRRKLGTTRAEAVRQYIVDHSPTFEKSISTSVDLPLDLSCRNALNLAVEEANLLAHALILPSHLVLGLLCTEQTVAAEALRAQGIEYRTYRDIVAKLPVEGQLGGVEFKLPSAPAVHPERSARSSDVTTAAPALRDVCHALASLVNTTSPQLDEYSEADGLHAIGPGGWLRKEALGHLIDWACTHQQWFARALSGPKLAALNYPEKDWIAAQKYREFDWIELADLWANLNRLLVHVIAQVPEAKLATPCKIGLLEAIPLAELITNYVNHCRDGMAEILTRR
jgi:hypothetical protein